MKEFWTKLGIEPKYKKVCKKCGGRCYLGKKFTETDLFECHMCHCSDFDTVIDSFPPFTDNSDAARFNRELLEEVIRTAKHYGYNDNGTIIFDQYYQHFNEKENHYFVQVDTCNFFTYYATGKAHAEALKDLIEAIADQIKDSVQARKDELRW